jgi:hypothetical protein
VEAVVHVHTHSGVLKDVRTDAPHEKAAMAWKRVLFYNEVFLLLPCLTWYSARTSRRARVVDCLRTWPLLIYAAGVAGGWPVHAVPALVVATSTLVANYAMLIIDRAEPAPFSRTIYALSYVSPISFVIDRPGDGAIKKTIVVAGNCIGGVYVAWQLVVAVAIEDAWGCYPRGTPYARMDRGYCPQANGDYHNSEICRDQNFNTGAPVPYNPLCDPARWSATVHKIMPAHVHFIVNCFALVAAVYAYQVREAVHTEEHRQTTK